MNAHHHSRLQLHQHFVIAMIVDVPGGMGVAALAEVHLAGIQRELSDAAVACYLKCAAFDGVEEVIVVMAVRFDALARLQRKFSDANLIILENHLGSDIGHGRSPFS